MDWCNFRRQRIAQELKRFTIEYGVDNWKARSAKAWVRTRSCCQAAKAAKNLSSELAFAESFVRTTVCETFLEYASFCAGTSSVHTQGQASLNMVKHFVFLPQMNGKSESIRSYLGYEDDFCVS